ncbi:MAG: hypothetical protein QM754_06060 [Tepidisphaeraceae bacterium]
MQSIATALEAYRQDFKEYPQADLSAGYTPGDVGAFALCRALLAPAPATSDGTVGNLKDGKDNFGFRMDPSGTGKVYGPYLQPDNFRLAYVTGADTLSSSETVLNPPDYARLVLIDRAGRPILYGPTRSTKPKFSNTNVYFAARGSDTSLLAGSMIYFDLDNIVGNDNVADPSNLTNYRLMIRQANDSGLNDIVTRLQTATRRHEQQQKARRR